MIFLVLQETYYRLDGCVALAKWLLRSTIFRAIRDLEMGDLVMDPRDKRDRIEVGTHVMSDIQVAPEVRRHGEDFLDAPGGADVDSGR